MYIVPHNAPAASAAATPRAGWPADRKSTRLNSSHGYISYAVFCLKKKMRNDRITDTSGWSNLVVYNNATGNAPCGAVAIAGNMIDGYATKFHWYENAGVVEGRTDI